MSDPLDALEKSIGTLRRAIRDAAAAGDTERAGELRMQLRRAERAWDALVDAGEPAAALPLPSRKRLRPPGDRSSRHANTSTAR
ncbi:hypothetical protein O1M54_51115 [Streptomyces diastatochromogenes]|nr:hypothetical protein [Streptomyces diastatochromogenes]